MIYLISSEEIVPCAICINLELTVTCIHFRSELVRLGITESVGPCFGWCSVHLEPQ